MTLTNLFDLGLRLLAPPRCAACDSPLARDVVFCPPCAASVLPPPLTVDWGRSASGYGGAVATAIVRFKFGARPDLARPLGHLMVRAMRGGTASPPLRGSLGPLCPHHHGASRTFDVVVPVPLHRTRLRERGYNQAALIGRVVAQLLKCAFEPLALERIRATAAQALLGAHERKQNVEGGFRARKDRLIRGRRVLLVDDVRTTGSTLDACRAALLLEGAVDPYFITMAQA